MSDPLASARALFEIPREVAYLNCGYMSPLLRASREAGERALRRKSHPWQVSAHDLFDWTDAVRAKFARLLGAGSDDIALVPSVSYGMAVATANLPLHPGRHVLMLEEAFPSVVYPWREAARAAGAELRTVARPTDDDWTAAVLAAIDERTAVAALPVCHWTDGGLLRLEAIRPRLREVGAGLVVDATQSVGVMPFDLAAVDPDFLAVAAYKWLLGPYSVGFLYAARRHQEGRPIEFNWAPREGSENFARLVDYRDRYQPGARRYDVGEVFNFTLLPAAEAGLDQLLEWRIDRIYTAVSRLAGQLARIAEPHGLHPVPHDRRAGHYLGLRAPGGLPPDLARRLAGSGVYVSVRGSALRVTPHLYNDEEDLGRFAEGLRLVLG